ncbi:MAG TPA: cupin domain-containing protein [Negativicutes bacterium]|nr:cupin domain-containing protein [Negativicutes bacterium]
MKKEIYYVLKGTGLAMDNGISQQVSMGDIILTGNGAFHSIENNSSEALEVLGIILLYK